MTIYTLPEGKGSKIQWKAECGHWMVVFALEPTPEKCSDCANKHRDKLHRLLSSWEDDIDSAIYHAESSFIPRINTWLEEEGISVSEATFKRMRTVSEHCGEAMEELTRAQREIRKLVDEVPPKVERLAIDQP